MLRILGLYCAVLALLCLPATAQTASSSSARTASASKAITLQPGDAIPVQIWREEDLSGEFLVDELGMVVLPMLGAKEVTGIPMRELLLREYAVQLRNPSIQITPLRRINILGEVNRPALHEVDPTISLAGAIAMAGGGSAVGDLNHIPVIRGGTVIHERVAAQAALSTADIRSGNQVFVERRSWFDRNSTFVVSVLLSVTSTMTSIALSR